MIIEKLVIPVVRIAEEQSIIGQFTKISEEYNEVLSEVLKEGGINKEDLASELMDLIQASKGLLDKLNVKNYNDKHIYKLSERGVLK